MALKWQHHSLENGSCQLVFGIDDKLVERSWDSFKYYIVVKLQRRLTFSNIGIIWIPHKKKCLFYSCYIANEISVQMLVCNYWWRPGSLHRLLNRYADACFRANNAPVKRPKRKDPPPFGRLKTLPQRIAPPLNLQARRNAPNPCENSPHIIKLLMRRQRYIECKTSWRHF